jgi:hypothetical protein
MSSRNTLTYSKYTRMRFGPPGTHTDSCVTLNETRPKNLNPVSLLSAHPTRGGGGVVATGSDSRAPLTVKRDLATLIYPYYTPFPHVIERYVKVGV